MSLIKVLKIICIIFSLLFINLQNTLLGQSINELVLLTKEADNAYSTRNFELAIKLYNQIIKIQPENIDILLKVGNSYAEIDDCINANEKFTLALIEDKNNIIAYNNRALCYLSMQQYSNALNDQREILRLNDADPLAYNNLGLTYSKMGKYNEAIDAYNKALEITKRDYIYYYNRADAYFNLKQYDKALDDCNAALSLKPNFAEGYQYRALIYIELNRITDALNNFSKSNQITKTISNYKNIASLYMKQKKYVQAIMQYDAMIKLEPTVLNHYWERGLCYYEAGKFANALADFSYIVSKNITHQMALYYKAKCNVKLKQYRLAKSNFLDLIAQEPRSALIYYEMGNIHILENEDNLAIKFLNTSLTFDSTYADAFYLRAKAYLNLGQINLAKENIEQAVKFDKTNKLEYKELQSKIDFNKKNTH